MAGSKDEAGGFFHANVASPQPASSSRPRPLPQPRSHALKAGSSKESALVNHVEAKLLEISGKHERRFERGLDTSGHVDEAKELRHEGYHKFAEVAKDLSAVIDVVWVSGTR